MALAMPTGVVLVALTFLVLGPRVAKTEELFLFLGLIFFGPSTPGGGTFSLLGRELLPLRLRLERTMALVSDTFYFNFKLILVNSETSNIKYQHVATIFLLNNFSEW